MRNHMAVGPLGFLITSHTSWAEHTRSLPPGPLTSTDSKKSCSLQTEDGEGWPHSRNVSGTAHVTPAKSNGTVHPHRLCFQQGQAECWSTPCSNQQSQAAVLQFPHLTVSTQLSKELICQPCPAEAGREVQRLLLGGVCVAKWEPDIPSPGWWTQRRSCSPAWALAVGVQSAQHQQD